MKPYKNDGFGSQCMHMYCKVKDGLRTSRVDGIALFVARRRRVRPLGIVQLPKIAVLMNRVASI